MSDALVATTISGDDSFTDPLTVTDYDFAMVVWGGFVGTLTLQVRPLWRDLQVDWIDVATYGQPSILMSYSVKGTCQARVGFKSGDHVSGKADIALYRGEDANARAYVTKKLV